MAIRVLTLEETAQIADMDSIERNAIDISSICNKKKLGRKKAIVFYHEIRGIRMFDIICGLREHRFVYEKIVPTIDLSIAENFNFFAASFGIEHQLLCNIILENNPW